MGRPAAPPADRAMAALRRDARRLSAEMLAQGYSGREQDTYGTLLACGDLLLHDDAPDALKTAARVRQEGARSLGAIVDAARAEAVTSPSAASPPRLAPPARQGRRERRRRSPVGSRSCIIRSTTANADGSRQDRSGSARTACASSPAEGPRGRAGRAGRRLPLNEDGKPFPMWLAVANKTNKGVQEIFAGSAGRAACGRRASALIDGAGSTRSRASAAAAPEGCVLVPLAELVDVDGAIEEAEAVRSAPAGAAHRWRGRRARQAAAASGAPWLASWGCAPPWGGAAK
jgi:hypothetical protein